MKTQKPAGSSDTDVIAILRRYQCPVPFHAVRTRFLGNIASPQLNVSPMDTVKQLWNGEMPVFDRVEEAQELYNVLLNGLWNRLTTHQSSHDPFKLFQVDSDSSRSGLIRLAQIRVQELDGFVEGLFGEQDNLILPESAHKALGVLSELRTIFGGADHLLGDENKPASTSDLEVLLRNLQQMSLIVEKEINTINMACKRVRRSALNTLSTAKPTVH